MSIQISQTMLARATDRLVPNIQPQRFRRSKPGELGVVWAARILPVEAAGSSSNLSDDEHVIILHHEEGFPLSDLERNLDTTSARVVTAFLNAWTAAGGTFTVTTGAAAKAYDATARARAASRDNANAAAVVNSGGSASQPRNSLASVARNVFRGGRTSQQAPAPAPRRSAVPEEVEEVDA